MENNPDLRFLDIHKDIREHFDFLFKRGFRITAAVFIDNSTENWVVTMLDDDWFVKIHCEQGHINLGVTNLKVIDEAGFLDLNATLALIGKGDDEIYNVKTKLMNEHEQVKNIAHLFKRHFNELITQFDDLIPTILDQGVIGSAHSINGRLSLDNRPFSFSV